MKSFVLELENNSKFYLNVYSNKEAALRALLKSDEEGSAIRSVTNQKTGDTIVDIEINYAKG